MDHYGCPVCGFGRSDRATLVTVQDFERQTGVVEVRDCDPEPSHITLVVERPGVAAELSARTPIGLTVHEVPA